MNTESLVVGSHGYFFPTGKAFTVPSAGTAGRAAKPGSADTGWIDLGISRWTKSPQHQYADRYKPAPGARQLYKRITIRRGLVLKGTLMEMSNLIWKMLHGADDDMALTGAVSQYNPLSGDPQIEGWLQLQNYDQSNTLLSTEDYYVSLVVPGDVAFGDELIDVETEAHVLFSTLNTGSLR